MAYNYLFKFIIIGDSGVGKSCLLYQFINGKFITEHELTIGVEFGSKMISIDNKQIKIQIWDTAGQELFRSITRSYYRDASGIIVCFDITRRETFIHVANWLKDALEITKIKPHICLVGTKSDLNSKRMVSYDEAKKYADENQLLYIETSSKTGQDINTIFHNLGKLLLDDITKGVDYGTSVKTGYHEIPLDDKKESEPIDSKKCCVIL